MALNQLLPFAPIDADNHYYEPLDAFTRHLDPKFRQRGVQVVDDGRHKHLLIGERVNRFVPNPTFDPIVVPGCLDPLFRGQVPDDVDPRTLMQVEPLKSEYQNRDERVAVAERQGLGGAFLFPTLGCGVEEALKHDVDATMASLSAFNQWLDDDWGFDYADRLIAAPMLSLADPQAALTELDRVIGRGARMVHIRPAPVPGANDTSRSLGDRLHDPVWARLAEASIPVAFHLGDSGYNAFTAMWGGVATFEGFGKTNVLSRILVSDRAIHDTIAALIVDGVFHRHPTLRVASIENGSDWMALLAKRLKKQANQTPWVFKDDPLDVMRNNVWVTPYCEEDLTALAELIGVERILFGSDWPHGEGLAEPTDFVKVLDGFDEGGIRRIMRDNALDLLGTKEFLIVANEPEAANAALRAEVRTWLEQNWDPSISVDEWWSIVARAGWTAPHFTADQGGRGLHRTAANIVRAEFAQFGALRAPGGLGLLMAAPTILTHGTPDQIARLVPPIVDGRANWCQLFSEPGAGSDLAGLTTRAERDGDRWIINGQKVWSSMAMDADHGMLLARTDFSVPKHNGISWFAFSLDQPGVTVRPLREMTGEAVFNEVFFDDAVCEADNIIGGEGNGWAVTQTTLFFERSGIGAGGAHAGFPVPGPKGGMLGRRAGDAAAEAEPDGNQIAQLPDLIALARARGRAGDAHIRQQIARLYSYSKLGQWNAQRGKAEAAKGGGAAVANLGKIAQTQIVKGSAQLGVDILGGDAMLAAPDGADGGRYTVAVVFSPASSIYGGTDEIQRNIIAERTLGLPREPLPGKGQPYGDVLRSINSRE